MKSGITEKISSKPPGVTMPDLEERLRRTEEWSTRPSRDIALAINIDAGQGAVTTEPVAEPPAKARTSASIRGKKDAKTGSVPPWGEPGDGTVSFNFKLPAELAARLKYVGGSTYGQNMTSIVIEAVTERVNSMLKERNLL